jgi:DNA-binding MarR family transcriptional regulator
MDPQAQPPDPPPAPGTLPLATLLSGAYVAFTIEADNEFEHRMPHRTATQGPPADAPFAPWLTSLAMNETCLRWVPAAGCTLAELEARTGTPTNLAGMERWGYVRVDRTGAPPAGRARAQPFLRLTAAGRAARATWAPLCALIEERWQVRFGAAAVGGLRAALERLAAALDPNLPDCLPILHYGLATPPSDVPRLHAPDASAPSLSALLARPLVTFIRAFEASSAVSLPIHGDVLRVLGSGPLPIADLPRRSGVSRAAIDMALGVLRERGLAVEEPAFGRSRGKVVRLTQAGEATLRLGTRLVAEVEADWERRFGAAAAADVRAALEPIVGDLTADGSPLFAGLVPYPDGWRASVRRPDTLPHVPMVLHRGGYPDGS